MMRAKYTPLLCALLILGLSACTSQYAVEATFPTPLVDTLPIDVGLDLSEEFQNYTFFEDEDDRDALSLEFGAAQSELFQVVAGQMFNRVVLELPAENIDLRIHPEVDTFQYAIPRETRANIYEVWIKYRIQVLDENNQVLADWLLNGYGKTPSAFLKSEGDALQAAVTMALRDIGVQFAIGFSRQQLIQDWLENNSSETI